MNAYIDEDPWQQYKGFGEDKYVVSYLEGIDSELKISLRFCRNLHRCVQLVIIRQIKL